MNKLKACRLKSPTQNMKEINGGFLWGDSRSKCHRRNGNEIVVLIYVYFFQKINSSRYWKFSAELLAKQTVSKWRWNIRTHKWNWLWAAIYSCIFLKELPYLFGQNGKTSTKNSFLSMLQLAYCPIDPHNLLNMYFTHLSGRIQDLFELLCAKST